MVVVPFPFNAGEDPARGLLAVLMDAFVLSHGGTEGTDEDGEEDDGSRYLEPEDDEHGNEVTSGASSAGWRACDVAELPDGLEDWALHLISQLPGGEFVGPVLHASRRVHVHYHFGVEVMGTCDWRAALPLRLGGQTGWLVIEWDVGYEGAPPLPEDGIVYLIFGASDERLPGLLCRRLHLQHPSLERYR